MRELASGSAVAGATAPSKDEEAYFGPSTKPDLEWTVAYKADYESPWDGTATAARLHARALHSTGIPVRLESITGMIMGKSGVVEPVFMNGLDDAVRAEVGHLRNVTAASVRCRIVHMVARSADHLAHVLVPRAATLIRESAAGLLDRTVLMTVWERDRVSDELADLMRQCRECWVPCEQNRAMLAACGVPSVVVPHPYDPEAPVLRLVERKAATSPRLYFIGRWEPRKAPHELVGAFLREFAPGEATLTIKHGSALCIDAYPRPEDSLKLWLDDPEVRAMGWTASNASAVTIRGGHVRQDQILALHFHNNIYCQVGHGEAWSLPAFDAKLAGNLLVHVPYGGTADYASEEDVSVDYAMGPVPAGYRWEPGAQWANVDPRDLRRGLREAARRVVGRAPARDASLARFELAEVGKLMRARLEPLL